MSEVKRTSRLEVACFAVISAVVLLTLVAVLWMLAFVLALIAVGLGFVGVAAGGKARSIGLGMIIGCVLATIGYVVYMNWF